MHSYPPKETGRQSRPAPTTVEPTVQHGSSRQENTDMLVTADNWTTARDVSATVPYLMTKTRKRQAISELLSTLLNCLRAALSNKNEAN